MHNCYKAGVIPLLWTRGSNIGIVFDKGNYPSAAARSGVFRGAIAPTAFLRLPACVGDKVLSILCSRLFGTGKTYLIMEFIKNVRSFLQQPAKLLQRE